MVLTWRRGYGRISRMKTTENTYPRIYTALVEEHLRNYRQMVFISGPRQVGKTTISESLATIYLNWDDEDVRKAVQSGQRTLAARYGIDKAVAGRRIVVFDEIHKYSKWKQFLKGFYDIYGKSFGPLSRV